MEKLDFLKQHYAFDQWLQFDDELTASAKSIYETILTKYVLAKRPEKLTLPHSLIMLSAKVSKTTFFKQRKLLVEKGLIKIINRGEKAPIYEIVRLYETKKEEVPESKEEPKVIASASTNPEPSSVSGSSSSSQPSSRLRPKTGTYNNYNLNHNLNTLSSKSKDIDSESSFLSERLFKKIKERDNQFTKPDLTNWAVTFQMMKDDDKRPFEELKRVLNFSQTNSFWKGKINNPRAFKRNYTTLKNRMETQDKPIATSVGNTGYTTNNRPVHKEIATDWSKYQQSTKKPKDTDNKALQNVLQQIEVANK